MIHIRLELKTLSRDSNSRPLDPEIFEQISATTTLRATNEKLGAYFTKKTSAHTIFGHPEKCAGKSKVGRGVSVIPIINLVSPKEEEVNNNKDNYLLSSQSRLGQQHRR